MFSLAVATSGQGAKTLPRQASADEAYNDGDFKEQSLCNDATTTFGAIASDGARWQQQRTARTAHALAAAVQKGGLNCECRKLLWQSVFTSCGRLCHYAWGLVVSSMDP